MNNWLEIVVGVYLICMVLYGHYRGFIRLAVSTAALIATLVIVHLAMPAVSMYVKEHTPVYDRIVEYMEKKLTIHEDISMPAGQRAVIENLNLPENIKELLIENNNSEIYKILGVEAFGAYLGSYLANFILNMISFLMLLLLVYIGLRLILKWLDILARLPVISGMNHMAGALLGGIQGLFYLWIAFLLVTVCSGTAWAQAALAQINASVWLSFLYHYNVIFKLALGILKGILS